MSTRMRRGNPYYQQTLFDKYGRYEIDHSAYQEKVRGMSDAELRYTIKDASSALRAQPEGRKAGYYQDEINYASDELARRRRGQSRNPYGYMIAGRTRPHAWSATRGFPYLDRREAKRSIGERVRAMGRHGDDVAFDAYLTEPKGRKISKTRIRVPGYASNPKSTFKVGERIIFTGGGVDSGRTGVVVPMQMISIGDRGVPKVPGAYKPLGKDDIAVKYDDGSFDVVNKHWISKPKTRNPYDFPTLKRAKAWAKGRSIKGSGEYSVYKDWFPSKGQGYRVYTPDERGPITTAFMLKGRYSGGKRKSVRNPRRRKFGSRSSFPLRSFSIWMSGGKTRKVKAHTANEAAAKAAGGPVIGVGGGSPGPWHFTSAGGRGNSIKVWEKFDWSRNRNPRRRNRKPAKRRGRWAKRRPQNAKGRFVKVKRKRGSRRR